MPLRFTLPGDLGEREEHLRNVSRGGVCFATAALLDAGQAIRLCIPVFAQQFEIEGRVAWCRPAGDGYEVGVDFATAQERFCVRMVEQLCYIEDYRATVAREEGRELSSEEAAREWVERFADQFPGLH
jgi:Tfp pilus assembly protein PilZ